MGGSQRTQPPRGDPQGVASFTEELQTRAVFLRMRKTFCFVKLQSVSRNISRAICTPSCKSQFQRDAVRSVCQGPTLGVAASKSHGAPSPASAWAMPRPWPLSSWIPLARFRQQLPDP